MDLQPVLLRLDQINVPTENPRDSYTPAGYRKLKASLERHGMLVPVIVRASGEGEYALVDGNTRIQVARELGWSGDHEVPAAVITGDDQSSLVAGVVINQDRERLSRLSEFRAVRTLVGKGMKQQDAAAALGKTPSWASNLARIDDLAPTVQAEVQAGKLSISHAIRIAKFASQPAIVEMLVAEAKKGKTSGSMLTEMGNTAAASGVKAAKALAPKKTAISEDSWVRIEPVRGALRAELHLASGDDIDDALAKVKAALEKVRPTKT